MREHRNDARPLGGCGIRSTRLCDGPRVPRGKLSAPRRVEGQERYGRVSPRIGRAVAQAEGQPKRATKLLGAVEALLERIGASLNPAERAGFDRTLGVARAQLDETTFNTEWAGGRVMTLEQTIRYVLKRRRDDIKACREILRLSF